MFQTPLHTSNVPTNLSWTSKCIPGETKKFSESHVTLRNAIINNRMSQSENLEMIFSRRADWTKAERDKDFGDKTGVK
ncbi:3558_t:CDS:2 [Gigaspora margarita]|uniref:3558_t:CDS:1 n=1 Tax=Gigaspora margarita TaxID=4874 RepID=A0ABN7UQN0_GIGMA|nr:3558_t:CDS:2 [Gigaspora margarita]